MLNDASDGERCRCLCGRAVFVLRGLGAAEVVKRVFAVHLSGGQAGLWATLAS